MFKYYSDKSSFSAEIWICTRDTYFRPIYPRYHQGTEDLSIFFKNSMLLHGACWLPQQLKQRRLLQPSGALHPGSEEVWPLSPFWSVSYGAVPIWRGPKGPCGTPRTP
jgi:hypothetical protein